MNKMFFSLVLLFALIQLKVYSGEVNIEDSIAVKSTIQSVLDSSVESPCIVHIELDKLINQNHIYIMEYVYDGAPYLLFYSPLLELYYIVTGGNYIIYFNNSYDETEAFIEARRFKR